MKKNSISKKILSMVLTVSLLLSLLPFENIFAAWTTPNNIAINDSTGSGNIAYFANQFGTPQQTNLYYVAGQPEDTAYCIDAEATGPGGTAYVINDSAIDVTFRAGLARIAQYGYPTNSWTSYGISATEAQYATQAAMHWWENAVFGGTEGWVRAGVVNNGSPTNFAGTLSYADWLLGLAGSHTSPSLFVEIAPWPTAWSAGSPPTSTFSINKYDCDSWTITLPAGVTYGGAGTISGTGNQNITVQLTNPAAFVAGTKQVTAQGFSNRLEGQIHYYVAGGGFQNMIVYQQNVSAAGDPDVKPFADAEGPLTLYKQTQWTAGVYSSEAGAMFQVYNSSAIVVAIITTDASGNASVDLPYGTYTIHQVSGPGYTVNAPDQVYTASASSPTAIFTNAVYTGRIEINKTYAALTGTVPEAGAVFQIFPDGSSYAAAGAYQKDQITTNGSGYTISKSLPYGTYTMVQTAAPVGSQINGTVWTFVLGADGATFINGDVDSVNISNTPNYGKLQISKNMNRGYNIPESGAIFEVFSTSYASYAAAPAALKDTLTTNGAGTALTKDLPYGNYRIHQTGMPAGTIAVADSVVTIGATNGATVQQNLVNTVYWGRVEINKTTAYAGNVKPEAGAVFEIYNTSYASYAAAPTAEKATVTTNASGYALSKLLPYGSYRMKQTGTPTGAQLNTTVWTFNLGIDGATYAINDVDTQNIIDLPTFGKLEIAKTTNRGYSVAEAGAVFEVYSTDYASFAVAPDEYKDTITTSATGTAITKDLPYGIYSIHQTVIPEGTITAADTTVTIGSTHGATVHRELVNEVYWGQAEIKKTTELAGNVKLEAGAAFQIYNTAYASYAAAPSEEKDTITTDAKGHAITKPLPYGTYTASQTVAPVGTQLNAGTWTFILGIDGTTCVNNDVDMENVVNQPSFGLYELSKTIDRGYSVDEEGAAFEIYCMEYASFAEAPAEYKDTITTDINGDAVTKLMPFGDYSVHQSVAPAGTKAVADYKVSLEIAQGTVVKQDLVNQTFWGDIQVLKFKLAPSDISGVPTPEADATFRIYPSEFAAWEEALAVLSPAQQAVLVDKITSDMGGVASSNHQLPYGEYTVEQIDTIANLYTFKVDAWQVLIGEVDDQTYTYVRNNEIYEQYLAVIKTDAETGQVIKIAGATFQILASDGVTVLAAANGDDSFVTDANGRIDIFGLALQVGNYFIRETAAPKGYVLNTDLKSFAVSIADHGSSIVTIDYGVDVRSEFFTDTAQTCQLIVEKQGEVLTSATLIDAVNADTGARYSDEDGSKLSIYQFGYSLTGKAGAVFEVFVGEKDIGDNAGLLKTFDKDGDGVKETELIAGTSLGRITTAAVLQKDGTTRYIASFAGLPLDSVTGTAQYVLREVTAPIGDLVSPEPLTYDFTFADQTITQIDQEQSITDARQKVQLKLEKEKEDGRWNVSTQTFDWPVVAADGILFGLYTSKDITMYDGTVLVAKDNLVDVLFTDIDGIGKTTQDLPMGSYYAKELKVTPDVVYDGTTIYPITCTPTDQATQTAIFKLNDGKTIFNRQIAGTMEIYKITADTNIPMVGVVFEVYDKTANLVDIVTTDFDGCAKTKVLPYGRYTLIETRSTIGYALHDKQTFSIYIAPAKGKYISEAQMTVEDQKMAQIEVYKVTADGTSTPMNGVIFGIFDAATNAEIARITTDIKGYGTVYALEGNYFLQEIKTWDGYALSTEKIPIEAEYAHLYTFRQTNTLTELRVTKTSTGGAPLAGMQFTVINKETGLLISFVYDEIRKGYVSTSVLEALLTDQTIATTMGVTGPDGTALILGLIEGEYIITEIVAPIGYNLDSKPTSTTIGTQSSGVLGASVTIKNSPVIPKTGEIGNDYNLILAGLCCLGFATTMLIILRAKKAKREKRKDQK